MISIQTEEHSNEEILNSLNPTIAKWFKEKFKSFSPPQKYAILDIKNKKNVLISSPTGSGKTLSAFLSVIDELFTLAEQDKLEKRTYCIYVSPLKALSNDIERNLNQPLKEIKELYQKLGHKNKINIKVDVRTGDTTASKKAGMLKNPPHILITTPESLAIVLSSLKFREKINKIDWCIIDEIHSLASSKRGVHLSLSLERLNHITNFTRIGLSATVSPLEEVAKFLVGGELDNYENFYSRDCNIVDVQFLKNLDMKVLCPVPDFVNTTQAKMNSAMYTMIHDMVQTHNTTLIFTNTRAATERVVHNLKDIYPKFYGAHNIGAHHGSLSKEHRLMIENKLKLGELKVVVSSTSLELGIDIGSIDLVILLGSPKSVARALQRIGRSGHKLDETAKGRIIVLDRDDLVECSVLLKSAIEKKIDNIDIQENSLDVLAQQIYGISVNEPMNIDDVYHIAKKSYCYRNLEKIKYNEIIDYLAGEFAELEERKVYAKIWHDKNTNMIGKRSKLARLIYMTNIGTIPDTTGVKVMLEAHLIGTIDEAFLERLKKGDVFVLGGNTYIFNYSKGMTAYVTTSLGRPPSVPSWSSEQLPLSYDLALEIQRFRKLMDEQFLKDKTKTEILNFIDSFLYVDKFGANAIYEYFNEQFLFAQIPNYKKIIIEHYNDTRKKYIIFHSLFGRRVNDVLSRAIAFAISKQQHRDVEIGINDNGFYISSDSTINVLKAFKALKSDELRQMMELALDKTEILKRRFRHCASRSLMILRSYMGHTKTVGRQQMSSQLLINAVRRVSEKFPILMEAKREILEELMDIKHSEEVINFVESGKIEVKEIFTDVPSPFAFNLVMQGYTDILRMEDRIEFLKRMHECVVERIDYKTKHTSKENEKFEKNVSDISEEMKQRVLSRVTRELTQEQSILLGTLRKLKGVNPEFKEEISKIIMQDDDVNPNAYKRIIEQREDIQKEYPIALSRFLFMKASENTDNFDYSSFWDEKRDKEKYEDELKVEKLKQYFSEAARRTRLEANFIFEGMRLIDGDTKGFKDDFINWLEVLLTGTVPMIWNTELVKFLKERLKEIK